MRGLSKQRKLKTKVNMSSTFDRSISAYGKTRTRFVKEIPCSNWLPADDNIYNYFLDVSSAHGNIACLQAAGRTARAILFDSDSDGDSFKPKIKKRKTVIKRKIISVQQVLPKKTRQGNQTSAEKETLGRTEAETSVDRKTTLEVCDNIFPARKKAEILEKCAPFEDASGVSKSDLLEQDLSPAILLPTKIPYSPRPGKDNHPKLNSTVLHKNHLIEEAGGCKNDLMTSSAENASNFYAINNFVRSEYQVNFNSSVVCHAANIEMTSPIISAFQAGKSGLARSTPLPSHKIDEMTHSNWAGNEGVTGQEVEILPVVTTRCAKVAPRNLCRKKKSGAKKPSLKKKVRKPAKWKKNGGISFFRKHRTQKSENDSILHQIMIGAYIEPKACLEDSKDAYFLNSCLDDAKIEVMQTPWKEEARKKRDFLKRVSNEYRSTKIELSGARLALDRRDNSIGCHHSLHHEKEHLVIEKSVVSDESEGNLMILAPSKVRAMRSEDKVLITRNSARPLRNLRRKLPINYKLVLAGKTACESHQPLDAEDNGTTSLLFSKLSSVESHPVVCDDKVDSIKNKTQKVKKIFSPHSTLCDPILRNLRPRRKINYKETQNGSWAQGRRKLCSGQSSTGNQELASISCAGEDSFPMSPDMFGICNLREEHDSFFANERGLTSEFTGVLNRFVTKRNRCKAAARRSNGSSLFSTLSFGSNKDEFKISSRAALQGSSTTCCRIGDDETNIPFDDKNVNKDFAVVTNHVPTSLIYKRKPAETHYFAGEYRTYDLSEHLTNFSDSSASCVDNLPPIPTVSTNLQQSHLEKCYSSVEIPSPDKNALLKKFRNRTSTLSKTKFMLKSHGRGSVRSPGSHLSSSVIEVAHPSTGISEARKNILDPIRRDLSSAILLSQHESEPKITLTPEFRRMSGTDAKVLVTPLSRSVVRLVLYRGNRIRLKSLENQDISIPKRLTSRETDILTAEEKVLCECEQTIPESFEKVLEGVIPETCIKLGEGLYGEVYKCGFGDGVDSKAVKVIPIEGDIIVNGEKQKSFLEILPEIISSKELHNLRCGEENRSSGFIELKRVNCVRGKYPAFFLDAWDEFDKKKKSDNDRPDMFPVEQLYLIFQYEDGGTDAEHFNFFSAAQAFSVLHQICASIAVAENSLKFEHRDLHWGNVLVSRTSEKEISGKLSGKEFKVATHGVKASIIDFTLSRLSKGGVTVFQDLAVETELFEMDSAEDYQFEIYRMMRNATKNNWSIFQPKNNVFWIHYLCDKFCKEVKYTRRRKRVHQINLSNLRALSKEILQYKSCMDILRYNHLLSFDSLLRRTSGTCIEF